MFFRFFGWLCFCYYYSQVLWTGQENVLSEPNKNLYNSLRELFHLLSHVFVHKTCPFVLLLLFLLFWGCIVLFRSVFQWFPSLRDHTVSCLQNDNNVFLTETCLCFYPLLIINFLYIQFRVSFKISVIDLFGWWENVGK